MAVHTSFPSNVSDSLGYIPRSGIAVPYGSSICNSGGNSSILSTVAAQNAFPTEMCASLHMMVTPTQLPCFSQWACGVARVKQGLPMVLQGTSHPRLFSHSGVSRGLQERDFRWPEHGPPWFCFKIWPSFPFSLFGEFYHSEIFHSHCSSTNSAPAFSTFILLCEPQHHHLRDVSHVLQ